MMALEQESPAAAHWSRAQYEGMLATRDPLSQRVGWVAEVEGLAETASHEVALLGFLIAHRIDAEWELENIAVATAARRRGVATGLLRALLDHVRAENGDAIFLEVRQSNDAARSLYGKAGFHETGLRKNYYSAPQEDAVLYRRRVS
jgi:[ribosomal protein S18]-alanine N-acetyltransferase